MRKTFIIFSLPFFIYLGLLLYPQIFFSNKISYKNFTLYSHQPINEKLAISILEKTQNLISQSELYANNINAQKIFLCENFAEFGIYALHHYKSFAINCPVNNNIFIASGDIKNNICYRNTNQHNQRTLTGVFAHEITHSLLLSEIGFWEYLFVETWKNEGYADMIAQETTINTQEGMGAFCQENTVKDTSFLYFKYKILVEYLLKKEKYTLKILLNDTKKILQIEKQVKISICPKL